MRKFLTICGLAVIFSCMAVLFWYSAWQYNFPTPVPKGYKAVKLNERLDISSRIKLLKKGPVLLHFFNPDCPCSRFNMPHFKILADKYASQLSFAVIVITNNPEYTAQSIRQKYELNMPVLFDTSLAAICGVYSTPQAVLIDNDQKLYYRGNYNKSRFCAEEKSNYVQMAIDSLMASHRQPQYNQYALVAYGCSLTTCK